MPKPFRYCRNLYTLKKSGSLVFCGVCNKIIGSINISSYSALYLMTSCTCGSSGHLQYSDTKNIDIKTVNRIPDYVNGVYACHKCKTPLFSVIPDRVHNYSFYVVCSCGEIYDTRVNHDRRLAETVRIIKEQKLKR